MPIAPRLKKHQLDFFKTAQSFQFKNRNDNIWVYQWGNGPKKVIFLHGWQSHSFRWKNYVEELSLAPEFTIYAMDAPGHGQSKGNLLHLPRYAEAIRDLLEVTGPVHAIVAHSMGAFATLLLLHETTQPIERIVLMGSPGEAQDFLDLYKKILHLSDRTVRGITNYFIKTLNRNASYYSAATLASTLKIPGLIIHDEKDLEAPFQYALDIQKAWKGSALVATTGLGHNLRSPEMVKQVIRYLIQGTVVSRLPFHKLSANCCYTGCIGCTSRSKLREFQKLFPEDWRTRLRGSERLLDAARRVPE